MKLEFVSNKLLDLYSHGLGKDRYPVEVVRSFVKAVDVIKAVKDQPDLGQRRGLRLEKLKGDLAGEWSLRLGKQFRLIVTFDEETCRLLRIEDYH